jgi:hypothetical protein
MSYRSYGLRAFVAILLLASASAAQAQTDIDKGPDYSVRGGEYSVLNNLMIYGENKVEYVGTERTEAYGVKYTAAKFLVRTGVNITAYGQERCPDDGRCDVSEQAEFEVLVGLDAGDEVHDRMLERIHDYWSANKPIKWKKADADEHLNYKDGKYIMFRALPGPHSRARSKRLVWVDGKVIKFEFKRFLPNPASYINRIEQAYRKDEALENFVGSRIRIRVGGVDIQARQMKGSFRKEFFKLYDGRAFGGAS